MKPKEGHTYGNIIMIKNKAPFALQREPIIIANRSFC
jgi:hypothetical protein